MTLSLVGATAWAVPIFSFTTCGATGATGPTQAACDAGYTATTLDGDVTVVGGIQSWTASAGTYLITATGAQGASATSSFSGGRGAQISGEFTFLGDTTLLFAVGQMGSTDGSTFNGGGGSFIVDVFDIPLLVAGGGGGTRIGAAQNGCDASTSGFGTIGSGGSPTSSCAVKVIDLGLGGIVSVTSWGSGGGGFFGDGAADVCCGGDGGDSWANGLTGGIETALCGVAPGAFGGFGGGGSGEGCGGGGGGGGYSGGDGGFIAGGGGSWNTGANPFAIGSVGFGDGSITVELISSVPEPTTLALMGLGLAGIGFRKRKAA